VDTHLPNAKEIRLKLRSARKREGREQKERRFYARWLLFCKGSGKHKNLSQKDKDFLLALKHEQYDKFVADLNMEKRSPRNYPGYVGKRLKYTRFTPGYPPSFDTYVRIWYRGAKANYIHHDVPKIMQMKMEALRNANGDTSVPKRGGRYMQQLINEISERERRDMDISLRPLPMLAGCEQGFDKGQKQVRSGIKKTRAGNRDAATVGKA